MSLTYKCLRPRCGHQWFPRKAGKPVVCPKCRSRRWNEKSR